MSQDEKLLAYLLDAMEPDDRHAFERRLSEDSRLREQLERMRRWLSPLMADDEFEPPPGLARRTLAYTRGLLRPRRCEWSARPTSRWADVFVGAGVALLLMTLILPAIGAMRTQQTRLACAYQLRHLGVALGMYARQEGGRFPFVAADGPTNNAGVFAVLLKTRHLLGDDQALLCPAAADARVRLPDLHGYLEALSEPRRAHRLRREIAGSYGYVLGYRQGERHNGYFNDSDHRAIVCDRPPRSNEVDRSLSNSPNHANSGQNVLFAGGQVSWIPSPRLGTDDLFHDHDGCVGAGLSVEDIVIGVSEATPCPALDL